ncbi:KilA-N domain-containing protein [Megavirus chiliensis]|uniref:N domain-containing n=2 Tax=Megamimivirinae TaxID=3044648 RepID=A0A2L2DNJ0_MIMIV|nr:transcriptional regulator [Megavirus chiliensis]AEQ32473.1 KilA-N domain-containing protein [Megavirus chiliensis]AVG47730.1 N domain-containing [Acanthamoeba polyphaga mimivirus]
MGEKKYKQVKKSSGSKTSKPVRTSKKVKNRKLAQKYSKKSLKTDSDNSDSEPEIVSYKRTNKKKSQKSNKYESDNSDYDQSESKSESESEIVPYKRTNKKNSKKYESNNSDSDQSESKSESESEIESEISESNNNNNNSKIQQLYSDNDIRNVIYEDINDKFSCGKLGDFNVIIMKKNGFVNATNLCKNIKKEFYHWKENKNSKELINELKKFFNEENEYMITITGGKNTKIRGTYVHPILLTSIANWISPLFAIKLGVWIEEWKNYSLKNSIKYYKALSKLESNSNNNKEKVIQKTLQSELGGEIEVKTKYGYIDLLTDDKIIEIKSYETWKHALGQILIYSDEYENKNKCVYLFDVPNNIKLNNIKRIYNKYNVSVIFIYE